MVSLLPCIAMFVVLALRYTVPFDATTVSFEPVKLKVSPAAALMVALLPMMEVLETPEVSVIESAEAPKLMTVLLP